MSVAAVDFFGVILGLMTLLIIGLGFVWVILGERYFGAAWAGYVLATGIAIIILSSLFQEDWVAAVLGVWGASLVWGSTELKAQAVRVKLGWFPDHAKKIAPPFYRKQKKANRNRFAK